MFKLTKRSSEKAWFVALAISTGIAVLTSGCGGGGGAHGGSGSQDAIPANVILYSNTPDQGATTNMIQVNPDGSGKKLLFHLPANFLGVALNLAVSGEKVFGYSPNGGDTPVFGIYRNSSISTSGMVKVVAPIYSFIENIQVSSDGAWVYYVASIGTGDAALYKVAITGGDPIVLDNSGFVYTSSVDIQTGTEIVYDKDFTYPDGTVKSAIFIRSTDPSGTPTMLINDSTANYACPEFSPDGTKIGFVSDRSDSNMEVYVVPTTGGNIVQVTDEPGMDKIYSGVAFSPDNNSLTFLGFDTGVYRSSPIGSLAPPTLVTADLTTTGGIYWTSSSGRAQAGSSAHFAGRRRRPAIRKRL